LNALARREIEISGQPGAPGHAQRVEACAWIELLPSQAPIDASGPGELVLEVRALNAGDSPDLGTPLARVSWRLQAGDRERWIFVHTSTLAEVPLSADRLVVELRKSGPAALLADLVQVGEEGGVHGIAPRHVSASYVARYRSTRSHAAH